MNIISEGPGITTQLWLALRLLLSLVFLFSPYFIDRELKPIRYLTILFFLSIYTLAVIGSIFYFKDFPIAYGPYGITHFKKISEYIISSIFILSWVAIYLRKRPHQKEMFLYMSGAVWFSVLAEIAFSLYASFNSGFNKLGHFLIFFSVCFIYIIFIRRTLNNPYSLLFAELKEANKKLEKLAVTDGLTGIFNYRFSMERISEQFKIARRMNHKFSIIMLDLDKFKKINDTYGHSAGDKVLVEFAKILRSSVREVDIVGRLGGDEFIICPVEASRMDALKIIVKIERATKRTKVRINNKTNIEIKFSAGVHSCVLGQKSESKVQNIVKKADSHLLKSKREKKQVFELRESM